MKNFGNFGGGNSYVAPEIYVEQVNCDNGFAGSGIENESYENGTGLSWDNDEE